MTFTLFYYATLNFTFLQISAADYKRRAFVSDLLTEMLEVDVNRCTSLGIRMLSVNFCDPTSIVTWLEMTRMVFDIGKRF
jgi:hypothetical protein